MHIITIIAIAFVCVASACAVPHFDQRAHYHFDYSVRDPLTGDNKAQREDRNGDTVKGSYTLREADGTNRVVEYVAGPSSGFQALVRREGQARHPVSGESHVGPTHWGHF